MTKRQHFVAASYLSKWDLAPPKKSRRAKVYWTDGELSLNGSAESLAHIRYLYARENTHISEGYFGEFEGDWNEQVEALEKKPTKRLLALILLQAVVMACRNPSLSHSAKKTRFRSTVSAIDTVINKVLIDGGVPKSVAAASLALHAEWDMRLVRTDEPSFLTSDNPAVLLGARGEQVAAILFPVSPSMLFFAARRKVLSIFRERFNDKEIAAVNTYNVVNSYQKVFSYEPFEEKELKNIRYFRERNRRLGMIGKKHMRLSTLRFPIDAFPLPMTILTKK